MLSFPSNVDFQLDLLDEIKHTACLAYKYKKVSSVLFSMGDNTMEIFSIRNLHDDFELPINENGNNNNNGNSLSCQPDQST